MPAVTALYEVRCRTDSLIVGDPRDYKWINTIQLQKTLEQVCIHPFSF